MQEFDLEFMNHVYLNPDDYDKSGGLWPINIGCNLAKLNYQSGPRSIRYYSLHFVKSGCLELTYDKQTIRLEQGNVFCLFPEQIYSYRIADEKTPLQLGWIAFNGKQAPYLLSSINISEQLPYLRCKITREFLLTFQQILHIGNSRSTRDRLNRYTLMYRLFNQLVTEESAVHTPTKPDNWIEDSKNYMHTHYADDISIQDVAAHVGIHRSYYSKMFTARVGTTPIQYLRQLRMDRALQMLQQGYSIIEIALSLGYSDSTAFTRAFHQYFGAAPTQYYQEKEKFC